MPMFASAQNQVKLPPPSWERRIPNRLVRTKRRCNLLSLPSPLSKATSYFLIILTLAWALVTIAISRGVELTAIYHDDESLQKPRRTRRIASERGKIVSTFAPPRGTCGQVYFWASGKAGSTSLFFILTRGPGGKENPNNPGPISIRDLEFGKEPCSGRKWRKWVDATKNETLCIQQPNNADIIMQRTHIMNGCPRNTESTRADSIMNLHGSEYTTFLMLIRDPVDRLVSNLNEQVHRRNRPIDVERYVKELAAKSGPIKGREGQFSYQGSALQALFSVVKDSDRILIIPMESLANDMQGVVDDVMDHIGGERWTINATNNFRLNDGNARHNKTYVTLTNATRDIVRTMFREDVRLLESLVGKRFCWSSWARRNEENSTSEKEWHGRLTTTPYPKYDVGQNGRMHSWHENFQPQKFSRDHRVRNDLIGSVVRNDHHSHQGTSKFWQKNHRKKGVTSNTSLLLKRWRERRG